MTSDQASALPPPLHISTQVEMDNGVGVLAACHFTKMGNGALQVAITTPSQSGASVVVMTPDAVVRLIRDLAISFLVEMQIGEMGAAPAPVDFQATDAVAAHEDVPMEAPLPAAA